MDIIDQIIQNGSYYAIFALVFGMNIVPLVMPPTWIVLASFVAAYPTLNPVVLALVGATASLGGRFVLMVLSSGSRKIMGERRIHSIDIMHNYLQGKKYAYFILTFLYALSPLPSSVLFIGYGLMRTRDIGIFIGFWLGRVISYFVLVSVFSIAFRPIVNIFYDQLVGVLIIDSLGLVSVIGFACVDWEKLITERKIAFIKPSLRK